MVIATRMLRIMGDDGDVAVPIHIHAPVEDDRSWRCDYEIGWPHSPRRYHSFGFDAVQALQLVNFMIGIDLQVSPYHQAGLLIFEDTDPGYGFPAQLPPDITRLDEHKAG